jgi:hypothetical protein
MPRKRFNDKPYNPIARRGTRAGAPCRARGRYRAGASAGRQTPLRRKGCVRPDHAW